MAIEHVSGKNKGTIMLYALSTCGWCEKTKQLLTSLGVEYDYEYVDLLQGSERASTLSTVRKHNPSGGFPTLLINEKVIAGFKENDIREALES